jgi:hypothetical protein
VHCSLFSSAITQQHCSLLPTLCTGSGACTAIPSNCVQGPGTPCCPITYKTAANPPLQRSGCPGPAGFCNYADTPSSRPPPALQSLPSGTCAENAPDCGQFNRSCCITTAGSSTGLRCGGSFQQPGPKGYCATPPPPRPGYTSKFQAPLKDLVCLQCPGTIPEADKSKYLGC